MEKGSIVKGRYVIKKNIGSGGMADVFLVYDKVSKDEFAMKMIKPLGDVKVGKSHERFKAEADVMTKINSDNVVQIYDAFLGEDHSETRKFIIMEYVEGITLSEHIKKKGVINTANSIRIIGQVLKGLNDMEKLKIIHRDIKPQNILIKDSGWVKIIDFGIVKTEESLNLTNDGSVVGSVQYIAPEILRGQPESPSSDIYSTGIIFYYMLTGVIPFSGTNMKEIIQQKTNNSPQPVQNYNDKIEPKLAAIVMKSISKEEEFRYQNSKEMLIDIKNFLEGEPLQSTTQLRTQKEKKNFSSKSKTPLSVWENFVKKTNVNSVGILTTLIGLGSIMIIVIVLIVLSL